MDPQQQLLLEVAWEALEDAGLTAARLAGSETGVYVGVSGPDYANLRLGDPAAGDAYFMTGITPSIVANRLSYVFDLRGPSFAVDTACSSSLVALHQACQALRSREVPVAIVGGVNLLLSPYPFIGFCQASMLSPTGRCHAFDARADGYVRAEGAGAVILKPLQDALADGDPIRAVIRGTGVNSDGHTMGLSLPNEDSQAALLERVYERAGIAPEQLTFIEAHGTGTQAGDPIELHALGRVLGRNRTTPLPIGSVKTNIGHLETASGMAGLIKTILAFEHRLLPPSLHFEEPNPHIPFGKLGLEVVTEPRSLGEGELLAGVNSFGFGGTNAHAVLASAPVQVSVAAASDQATPPPLLLSARSKEALATLARDWAQKLAVLTPDQAAPLLRAQARHRDHHRNRLHVAASHPAAMAAALSMPADSLAVPSSRVAFVYSGNGAQFAGMARDALAHSAAFRAALAMADAHLAPLLGWSVRERLQQSDAQQLRRTDIAQPLLFAVQVAITEALRARGIEADVMFGHSVGEIAAAWSAGALPLDTACRIVVARSRQQHRTMGMGSMAALTLDNAAEALGAGIEVAAYNSRSNITVAGPRHALAQLQDRAEASGWRYTALDLDYAFHSHMLDAIESDLLAELGAVDARACGDRFISTVTGETCDGALLDKHYWWRNVRNPVLFRQAAAHAVERGIRILVEIGPNPILQSYLRDSLRATDADGRVLATLTRQDVDGDPFEEVAGRCYGAGQDPSGHALFDGTCDIAGLPRYPWQRERFWFPVTADAVSIVNLVQEHALLGCRWGSAQNEWRHTLDLALQPWLADHAVEGMAVLPAAAMLELAMAAAHLSAPDADALTIGELEIRQALALEEGRPRTLRVRLEESRVVRIESRARLSDESWTLHAVARLAPDTGRRANPQPPALPVRETMAADALYAHAGKMGLQYGPHFRTVSSVEIFNRDNALARLAPGTAGIEGYLLAPALVDGGVHAFLSLLKPDSESTMLPWRMTGLKAFAPFGRVPHSARLSVTRRGKRSACGQIVFYDADGLTVAEMAECWFRKVRLTQRQSVAERVFHFALEAQPLPGNDSAPAMEPALLLAASGDTAVGDAALLLEAYVVSAAREALAGILPADAAFAVDELAGQGFIHVDAAPLLSFLLALLARHGAAIEERWQWRLTACELPEPSLIWRTIVAETPALVAELALAAAAAESLPDFLRHGVETPLPRPLVEQMLHAGPNGRVAADALRDAVLALAARWPKGQPLRILEVNAGSGVLARQILDALSAWPGTLRYVAADGDTGQAAKLAARFEGHPRARAVCWDATSEVPGRFDLILSAYGFSRGSFAEDHLGQLSRALVPNGLLLAAEPEPGALWTWIFGQHVRWWDAGVAAEFPVTPLKSAADWQAELAQAGLVAPFSRALDSPAWAMNLISARRTSEAETLAVTLPAATVIAAAPQDACAAALEQQLRALGGHVTRVPLSVTAQALAGFQKFDLVVMPPRPEGDVTHVTHTRSMAVLEVARAAAETAARLWIVTQNAQQPGEQTHQDAALWGLGRTIANEMPSLDCRMVDSGPLPPSELACLLTQELTLADGETEIVLLPQGRHVMRLARGMAASTPTNGPVRLVAKMPGRLESLTWEPQSRRGPGPDEVVLDVRAADVNFRDVMWSLDLLPEEALLDGYGGPTLGLACAGIVRAVGTGVTDLHVGDPVLAIGPASFRKRGGHSPSHRGALATAGLDFAAAATLPVAFVTVLYALGHLANLEGRRDRADPWRLRWRGYRGDPVCQAQGRKSDRHGGYARQARIRHPDGCRSRAGFTRPVFCRRRQGRHAWRWRGRRAEFVERRGDGAKPGAVAPLWALPGAGQAGLFHRHARGTQAAAPQCILFCGGRGRIAAGQARFVGDADGRADGIGEAACAAALAVSRLPPRRCGRGLPPDAGGRPYRQDHRLDGRTGHGVWRAQDQRAA